MKYLPIVENGLGPIYTGFFIAVLVCWIFGLIYSILLLMAYKKNFRISYSVQDIKFIVFYFGKAKLEPPKLILLFNYLGTVYFFSLLIFSLINGN